RPRTCPAATDRSPAHCHARDVPAEGQVLLHAADHGTAGRLVAEYANDIGAVAIVLGAPAHGGLQALMDASASRELGRHARSNGPGAMRCWFPTARSRRPRSRSAGSTSWSAPAWTRPSRWRASTR